MRKYRKEENKMCNNCLKNGNTESNNPYTLKSNVSRIVESVSDVLTDWDVKHNHYGVLDNIKKWALNKQGLYDVMRKSPYWDEETLSIIHKCEASTENIDQVSALSAAARCIMYGRTRPGDEENAAIVDNLLKITAKFFGTAIAETVSEKSAKDVNQLIKEYYPGKTFKIRAGQKTTRALHRLCVFVGVDKNDAGFKKMFGEFSTNLDTKPKTYNIVISIHPISYLLMSYGKDWSSCHSLNGYASKTLGTCGRPYEHSYRAGTLSYMNDSTSFVVYGLQNVSENKKDILTQPKLWRNMFHVGFNEEKDTDKIIGMLMMQSRLYPWGADNQLYNVIRSSVSSIMSQCAGIASNRIKLNKIRGFYQADTMHYPDYKHEKHGINVTKFGDMSNILDDEYGDDDALPVGSEVYCLECGNIRSCEADTSSLLCDSCDGGSLTCCWCGDDVCEDVAVVNEHGETYCQECYNHEYLTCPMCEQVTTRYYFSYVGEERWCRDCLTDLAFFCDRCQEYHDLRYVDMYYDGKRLEIFVCKNSLSDNEDVCTTCRTVFDKANIIDGQCKECREHE